ncbi:hyalin-like [Amphiura filiformis]|uniref:hyalin-like n=1 Tax=Amphiura filiformis TaxID=82378 RepID=UPI003B221608
MGCLGDRAWAANPCQGNLCQNAAACIAFPGSTTLYQCSCSPCFYGQYCENRVDQCQNHKCQNGAICQAVPNSCTDYTCVCSGCFQGAMCNIAYNPCTSGPNPCLNGALCNNLPEYCTAFECQCQGCFTGYRCENPIPSPCLRSPCQNGGQCIPTASTCYTYNCNCQIGFTGFDCGQPTTVVSNPCNNFPCNNGGTCINSANGNFICACPTGYGGTFCDTPISTNPGINSCLSAPCLNGGLCYTQYDGSSSMSFVNQYVCVCSTGFTGVNCMTTTGANPILDICTIEARVCQNGGLCQNAYLSFSQAYSAFCICQVGFVGEFCERSVLNPCGSSPCQNNGQCTSFNSYFVCQCPPTFTGPTCEIPDTGDNTPPVIRCPDDITALLPMGQTNITLNFPLATAIDNSGATPRISYSQPSGSLFNLGTTTVTATASDPSGNTATCTFNVTLTDTEPPMITCPAHIEVTSVAGQPTPVTYDTVATDNSGFVTVTVNPPSGSAFRVGDTLVTATAFDQSGNTAVCTFNVTVTSDTTPPTISHEGRPGCPENIQVQVPQGQTVATATFTPPIATDGSGIVLSGTSNWGGATSISILVPSATVVEYVFRDSAGNEARCVFSVSASTFGGPTIDNCPDNIIASHDASSFLMQFTWIEPTIANTANGALTVRNVPPETYFGRGCAPVFYVFENGGASEMCAFAVCLWPEGVPIPTGDTTPPSLMCPSDVTAMVPVGQSVQVTYQNAITSDDSGGNVNLVYSPPSGSNFNVGNTLVTVRATDDAGNSRVCTFNVIVEVLRDTTPPTISHEGRPGCPENIQVQVPQGQPVATATFTPPIATDASGVASSTSNWGGATSISILVPSATVVEYVFRDNAGNEARCVFSVSASTFGGPTIGNCPDNIIATHNTSTFLMQFTWSEPTSALAGQPTVRNVPPETYFGRGCAPVFYVFESGGASETCAFAVCLWPEGVPIPTGDTTPPSLMCPSDVTAMVPVGQTTVQIAYPNAITSDDSGGSVNLVYSPPSGSNFNVGNTLVTVRATDDAGNSRECTFNVIVEELRDTTPPTISHEGRPGCPENIQVQVPQGQPVATATFTPPIATDASGVASSTSNWGGATSISILVPSATVVEYVFRDNAGNEARCVFSVSASTFGGPTIDNCPDNIIATHNTSTFLMQFTWSEPTSAIAGQPTVRNVPPETYFGRGCAPVFYVFESGGASETCAFAVCLWPEGVPIPTGDTTPPSLMCPSDVTAMVPVGQSVQVTYQNAITSDDSGGNVNLVYSPPSGSNFNVGNTLVTVRATDDAGNSRECTFNVIVQVPSSEIPMIANCDTTKSASETHVAGITASALTKEAQVMFTEPTGMGPNYCINTIDVHGLGHGTYCLLPPSVRPPLSHLTIFDTTLGEENSGDLKKITEISDLTNITEI